MTDTTAGSPGEAATPADQSAEQNPAAAAGAAAADPAAAFAQEAAQLKDKLLRTLAEMENLRRRTEREVNDARQYGIAGFARDVLGVADNMRRALDAIGPELRADPNGQALIDGVELTEREFSKALEKNGVARFEPQGEKFDPNLQQAMYEVPDPSVPAGTVVQVIQAGYKIGDRVLRPALVAVAKGAPKEGAPKPPQDPVNDNASTAPSGPGAD
jgi:molecular chaperone GrpE